MTELATIAPAFRDMAHRIVWCTVATVAPDGSPRTRVLHPIWEWDGATLTGWIATSPISLKAQHLDAEPRISLTYWEPSQDTCSAECVTSWDDTPELREEGWRRFADGPEPVGYDPSVIPPWTSPEAPGFGILRLEPFRLRLMPGSMMTQGAGDVLTWSAGT